MSDWQAAVTFYNGRRADDPAFDVIDDMFASRKIWNEMADRRADWFELVKIVRSVFLVPIDEAHRLILSHDGFRRLAQAAIDSNARCAAYARRSLHRGKSHEILELEGGRPVIRLTWRAASPRI